jgi:cell division septation protein DedD
MNNHQRGVYQPLMENIPVYDLSDEDVEEEERSRLPLLIVIALLVLAAFAGVVWLAYNQGVARGRAGAEVVIAAPEGPLRTPPDDPGGAATPYTGLKVYEQPVSPDQEARGSTLAPAVPQEVVPETSAAPAQPAAGKVQRAPSTEAPPVRLNPETPAVASVRDIPPAPPPAAKPAPAAPSKASAAAVSTPTAAATARSAASGAVVLQIGAYESEDIANGAWAAFKARHAEVAGSLAEDVKRVDLGAKGIWYRLRVGPFSDKGAAAAACERLKAQGGTCFLAAP